MIEEENTLNKMFYVLESDCFYKTKRTLKLTKTSFDGRAVLDKDSCLVVFEVPANSILYALRLYDGYYYFYSLSEQCCCRLAEYSWALSAHGGLGFTKLVAT